jgi:hypothetical protein
MDYINFCKFLNTLCWRGRGGGNKAQELYTAVNRACMSVCLSLSVGQNDKSIFGVHNITVVEVKVKWSKVSFGIKGHHHHH